MERIRYFNVETLSDLSKVKFSGDPGDTTYFTYSDTTLRQGAPDVAWHGVCTVAPVGQVYSHGKFYFPGRSGYSGTVYGVQWDTTDPSPECTRIGNMSLHATLPVQSQMVGGTMADDGTFTEFSNQGDWTGEVRDGSIGQVMVRIPTFWIKFETWGDVYKVLMSAVPVVGFTMVKKMYVSAYEASLDRTDLKLSSVVNTSARYRGGNNNSSWDAEDTAGEGGESHRSLLGRPATLISLTDFRTYARKRGSTAWNCHFYLMQRALYWLYVCEYATLNSQKAYDASTTSEGYRKGGLGDGVSTWDGTSWNNFNGYYPIVPCGWTDTLGNNTGVRNYTVYNASGTALKTFAVPRYRGVENPWGHIWKHTDGILCQVYSGTDGVSQVYATDTPADFSSTSYSAYRLVGNELRVSQYVSQLHLGTDGDITAKAGGGNSTSYYCDYHYTDVSSTSLRAVLFGGNSALGTTAGLVFSNSSYAPSATSACVGSRLCYFDAWKDVVYEEHEWLRGRNGAYIDTNYYPIVGTDVFSVHFHYDGTIRNPDGVEQCIFGCQNGPYGPTTIRAYINGANYLSVNYHNTSGNYFPSTNVNANNWEIADLKLAESNFSFIANGVTYTFSNNDVQIETMPNSIWVFKNLQTYNSNCYFHGDIAYFKITDNSSNTKMNLIPCRLLRPIPATLDGNGIARQAGECGMWDKVSNKFYGNVASTGRFTVEGQRLYEEYDWLKGDGTAYIDTLINKLKGIITVDIDRTAVTSNSNILGREAYPGLGYESRCVVNLLRQNNNYIADIYGVRTTSGYGVNINMVDTLYLDLDTNIASTKSGNSTSIDIRTDIGGYNMLLFAKNSGSAPSYCWSGSIGSFKMADIIDLTPVRLLRPLPAYMDANGKPRAAGECGMWDKVSNKFYGNVATSGRFTVLNN